MGPTEKTIFERRLEEAEGVCCHVVLWEELVEVNSKEARMAGG